MGCDIHGFWEFKTPHGKWVAFELINDSRSYSWFGLIGGVRRPHGNLDTERRGIPGDCSNAWKQTTDVWGRDLHSHTWLMSNEVKQANRDLFLLHKEEDEETVSDEDLAAADHYHETIPSPDMEIEKIFLPGPDGNYSAIPWTGTLEENVGSRDLSDKIRIVVAFDN